MPTKVKRTDKLAQVMANLKPASEQYSSDNGKDQKTTEFYMEVLERHQRELGKQRLTVWMQVGSFFEVYGFKWPDGRTLGNVWDVAADLDIKIARKKMLVMNDPNVEVYMAGVKEEYADPYLERLVDQHGWTVAIYVQEKMAPGTDEFKRVLKHIASPGLNFESDSISNVLMYIYFKATPSRMNAGSVSLNCGLYYADCINGNNGIQELNSSNIQDPSVLFSELIKIITIRNPAEVIVHCDFNSLATSATSTNKLFTDAELVNVLGLQNRTVKFIRTSPAAKYFQQSIQSGLMEKAFAEYKGRGCIMEELGLAGQYEFGRLALCLALEYIFQHDTTILTLLERPELHKNSGEYLMLANNCLQQLDIIDPTANNRVSHMSRDSELVDDNKIGNIHRRKISLLDLLDKTKSVIGRRLFRQRLSTPITNPVELQARYELTGTLIDLQTAYMTTAGAESINAPFSRLRHTLGQIRDIPKLMRKIATFKFTPSDVDILVGSLRSAIQLENTVVDIGLSIPRTSLSPSELAACKKLLGDLDRTFNYKACDCHWSVLAENIFNPGYSKSVDTIYEALCLDRQFFGQLKSALSMLISEHINQQEQSKKKRRTAPGQQPQNLEEDDTVYIREDSNTRLGQYLYLTEKNKEILDGLDKYQIITIGNYQIKLSDIKYEQIRKSTWQIQTNYLELSSRNMVSNLEQLRKEMRAEFIRWQTAFYQSHHQLITRVCAFIGETDVVQSVAYVASQYGYCKPVIAPHQTESEKQKSYLKTQSIRHPIVERIHTKSRYVSNNLEFGMTNQDGILLFGVNASGKSTTMKALGCAIIMAQAGMWVPAAEFTFWPYSYLFTRIRNNDDIHAGLSSFEVEMREFKTILKYANENSMILGDELCSGTETLDATAIVASGLKLLSQRRANYIFATHLHFLSEIPEVCALENLKFYHLSVSLDPNDSSVLVYDRELRPGNGPQSYGIIVCRSMNLDLEFIREAERIRLGIERGDILGRFSGRLSAPNATLSIQNNNKTELAPKKASHFNTEKLVDNCEVCGAQPTHNQIEVHHIDNQCHANKLGVITNQQTRSRHHKNEKWNLVNLCQECHLQAHGNSQSGQTLVIDGYILTSQGAKLNWRRDTTPPPPYSPPNSSHQQQAESESTLLDESTTINQHKTEKIKDLVLELHKAGKTFKAIQHALREQHQIRQSLREISALIDS